MSSPKNVPLGLLISFWVFARILAGSLLALVALAGLGELGLRASGQRVRQTLRVQEGETIPDPWTQIRLAANRSGPHGKITNHESMRAQQNYQLRKTPGRARIAVLGSSVVFSMFAETYDQTIPAAMEASLRQSGINAEVLNFGVFGFSLTHMSAHLQAYVHQFNPDVVVAVMDLQTIFPGFPSVIPDKEPSPVRRLSWSKQLLKRVAEQSVLANQIDLRLEVATDADFPEPTVPKDSFVLEGAGTNGAPSDYSRANHVQWRTQVLGAPAAAMAAFCRAKGIALYFVSPYGPYYLYREAVPPMAMQGSLSSLFVRSSKVYGGFGPALAEEADLAPRILKSATQSLGAHVLDLSLSAKSMSSHEADRLFEDGIHFTKVGNTWFGAFLSERLLEDSDFRKRLR